MAHSGACTIVCGKGIGDDDEVVDLVRVWVVDDQASFRRATAATLETMDDFVMAGESETGETALERIGDGAADIVLMDIHMPGMGGIEAARHLSEARTDVMIVLMSTYDVEDLPVSASVCGAASYLHKERLSPDVLRRLWRAGA
jgi:two-component system, NarL family, invasion response regulator UvrY